ncbi:TPA: VapE domain-containing protein [Vibrio vulnificus]
MKQASPDTHKNKVGDGPNFPDQKVGRGTTKVLNTADNLKALLSYLGAIPYLNTMTFDVEVIVKDKVIPSDELSSLLISESSKYGFPPKGIENHLHVVAKQNKYHPVERLLNGLEWDGIGRVDDVISCIDSKYPDITRVVMKRWLVGCIASLYESNFKSKLVPIIQGEQSFTKTAFIARLASLTPFTFLEGAELNPNKKDSVLSCINSWIIELGELERSTKNCQGALKAFISKQMDSVRPPYHPKDVKKPRQSHFIATVNGTDFLKDRTGNSRYAVIELTGQIDIDRANQILGWTYKLSGSLTLDQPERLKQFWLEVKSLYESGAGWMLSPEEQKKVDIASSCYLDKGNWYQVLLEHLHVCASSSTHTNEWLAPKQICEALNIPISNAGHVGRALKMLADEGQIETRHQNGYRMYVFPVA